MVVYTNADFISLNEENLTYSVLVEDKGKIAYIGYNTSSPPRAKASAMRPFLLLVLPSRMARYILSACYNFTFFVHHVKDRFTYKR